MDYYECKEPQVMVAVPLGALAAIPRRERIATQLMAGMLANQQFLDNSKKISNGEWIGREVARAAVNAADALMEALDADR